MKRPGNIDEDVFPQSRVFWGRTSRLYRCRAFEFDAVTRKLATCGALKTESWIGDVEAAG
jgi:hypothetical protein